MNLGPRTLRLSRALIAALGALLVAAAWLAPARADAARAYTPPGNKIFAGVSDFGNKAGYFDFADAVGSRVAVMQAFEVWGGKLEEAKKRWKRTETRGMLSISTSPCYECGGVISPRQIASGKGDAYLYRLNRFLADWNKPTYVRLFPEMNGHWNAYAAFNADGSSRGASHKTKHFKRAWRRIVLIVRGGPRKKLNRKLRKQRLPKMKGRPGKRLRRPKVAFQWVPQTHGSPRIHKNRPGAYWPGARFVDWVGADIYGKYPNFAGLDRFYRKRKNFPFVIGEWSPWDTDNPKFVRSLHNWVESHRRVKLIVYYQGFGEGNPFLIQRYPRSARALAKRLKDKRYKKRAPHSRRPGGNKPGGGGVGPG